MTTMGIEWISLFFGSLFCLAQAADKYFVDLTPGIGRKFDGVGAISGGGATSKLLVNYPGPIRDQILDYLFKPNFGASLHILKVEIGGDGQSSEGTELSHMHNSWDENYERGYEWWMMKEAKKRNPAIKLYGLPWSYPGWVGEGHYWPFHNPNVTATYIIKWILGAKKVHGLDIDYIGTWNEKPYDITYIEALRSMLDSSGLAHVKIVAADMIGVHSWDIVDDLMANPKFNASVDIVGAHYIGTVTTPQAKECGKPLWSSEDFSATNSEIGGGCMAKQLNHNYVNGLMTSTIAWNLISSYYEHLPYPRKGLMTAEQPWSGHYEVNSPIWTTAHTTQFTEIGWEYLTHGAGVGKLNSGGTYVSLMSPDRKDFTLIIESMNTQQHSLCLSTGAPVVDTRPQNATFSFKGQLANISTLNVWYSKLGFGETPSTYFKSLGPVKVTGGVLHVTLGVNEVYTFSTLKTPSKGQHPMSPPSKAFPLPYKDNFDSYQVYQEAGNLAQQVGGFEITQTNDVEHHKVVRQAILQAPIHWCPLLQAQPMAVIGDYSWSNVTVQVDVKLSSVNQTTGAFVALRVDQGGCTTFLARGLFLYILPESQQFQLTTDIARVTEVTSGDLELHYDTWYTLKLSVKGTSVQASVNGKNMFSNVVKTTQMNGFVAMGTDSFGVADFDNLVITGA